MLQPGNTLALLITMDFKFCLTCHLWTGSPPEFLLTRAGSSSCPDGYAIIADETTCRAAQVQLSRSFGGTSDWATIQSGCFAHANNNVWFNTNANTIPHASYSSVCSLGQACPTLVAVSGASAQSSRMGQYTMGSIMQGNRPVYQSGGHYLYYWPEYEAWRIGSDYNNANAGLISRDNMQRMCPDHVTNWYQWSNGWQESSSITCVEVGTYVFHDNRYCDGYGYRGNNCDAGTTEAAAKSNCDADPSCTGVAQYECGSTCWNYCGGATTHQNYGAGRCYYDKARW